MRYLVLSDIHANIDAFESVLSAADADGFDQVVVLGDLVGYGGAPNEVVTRIRELHPQTVIRGNHDKAAAGLDDAEGFNPVAREGALWTRRALTADNLAYLLQLPAGPVIVDDEFEICHGTPFDEDAYVFDALDGLNALRASRRQVCLFGHTHSSAALTISRDELGDVPAGAGSVIRFLAEVKYLINVGSVGQPRDGDPRAGYGLLDTDRHEIRLFRIGYPIERAQERIRQAGLPELLARRLGVGR